MHVGRSVSGMRAAALERIEKRFQSGQTRRLACLRAADSRANSGSGPWGVTHNCFFSNLLEALDPRDRRSRWELRHRRLDATDHLAEQFERLLDSGQFAEVKEWVRSRTQVLLLLVGHQWALSEAIHDFGFGKSRESIDYLVANGQSFRFGSKRFAWVRCIGLAVRCPR